MGPSIEETQAFPVQAVTNWMAPIFSYIKDGGLSSDPKETKKMKIRVT